MSDEFKDLAQVAADAVVSAMAADSYEVAKRRFAALFGLDRQLESTHADLAARSGRDLTRARTNRRPRLRPSPQSLSSWRPEPSPAVWSSLIPGQHTNRLFVNAPGNGDVDAFSL